MDKRILEWLSSVNGLSTAIATAVATPALLYAAITSQLGPISTFIVQTFDLPTEWVQPITVCITVPLVLLFIWFAYSSYRRSARSSRLKQPDRFTLNATTPESLIGRSDDLAKLLDSVVKHRIILLDGESGCGKSALISAGLVPRLKAGQGLLPVLVRDWSDDWERGPLAAALGALHEVLSPEQRTILDWTQLPDLAADAKKLTPELEKRFVDVTEKLYRLPLLIIDQFDDYQAGHREKFLDVEGNWLKPDVLATSNKFWNLVMGRLRNSGLHLLVVTRADTASGLSCLRFLESSMTVDRQIPRVEVEYLRQLLDAIAPDDEKPPVVSDPDQGWHALQDRLEADLRAQGAILMQQVRTVLLGLRQLPILTVSAYRRAGELRGVEALVVARAIRRAGDCAGGGESGQTMARKLLGALVLPGGANQPPKAQRRTLRELDDLAGVSGRVDKIMWALQAEDVVRPAEGSGSDSAWQLDHDYLARAVLAEARQADRLGETLRVGLDQFRHASNLRQRWAGLLPIDLQARLAWERLRGRIHYGNAASYALASLCRPGLMLMLVCSVSAGTYLWNQDRQLNVLASEIYDGFGTTKEEANVLKVWRAAEPVRSRLFTLIQEDEGRMQRALNSRWSLAHAGFDSVCLLEVAQMLRARLEMEQARDTNIARSLARSYAAVAARLTEQKDIKAEVEALRVSLEQEHDSDIASLLVKSYAAMAARLTEQKDIKSVAVALRTRMEQEDDSDIASSLAESYAEAAARLTEQKDIKAEVEALRISLKQEHDSDIASSLEESYAMVVTRLTEQKDIKAEVEALRVSLEQEHDSDIASFLVESYAAMAARLTEQKDIKSVAVVLRARMEQEDDSDVASSLARSYAAVAAKLAEQKDIKSVAVALRARLEQAGDSDIASSLAESYAMVASRFTEQQDIKSAAMELRARLEQEKNNSFRASWLAESYASVAARLTEQKDIKAEVEALRVSLVQEHDSDIASSLAESYSAMAAKLAEQKDIKAEVEALRVRLEQEHFSKIASLLAKSYSAMAARLTEQKDIKAEVEALRVSLEQEHDSDIASSLAKSYATVAAKLAEQKDIKVAVAILRARSEQNIVFESREAQLRVEYIVDSFAWSYAAVAARLTEQKDIKAEVEALRVSLVQEQNHDTAHTLTASYAAVATRLSEQKDIKAAAAVLRTRPKQMYLGSLARSLTASYTKVATRLTEQEDIRAEAEALRVRLEQEHFSKIASLLAESYSAMAARLTEQKDIKAEVEALRVSLEQEHDSDIASSLVESYATVAAKLAEHKGIEAAAAVLRTLLEQESSRNVAESLAENYAAVARRQAEQANGASDVAMKQAIASEILLVAGHPFLEKPTNLLAALEPISGQKFLSGTGEAVSWWVKEFNSNPARLRPSQ